MASLTKKDKQGLGLFALVAVALLALMAVKISFDGKPKAGPDNCVGTAESSTVIVVDHSESITDQTRAEILARAMRHIHEKVKINERVSVFTVSDMSKASLKPLVSVCRPPETGNRIVENPEMIRQKFQKSFEQPIRQALEIVPANSKESPIAQSLTDLSLSAYLRSPANQLLIFSDMLENTAAISMYKCKVGDEAIAEYRKARAGARERPAFANTSITLNLIPRFDIPKVAIQCRDKFWLWFFGDNTGAQAELLVDYLPGGQTGVQPRNSGAER